MNKRGQMYILAAIVLSIAIFSVMKVTNQFVAPAEDNFDFFIENFEGERNYVMNLGLLEEKEDGELHYLKGTGFQAGLLETFQDFGINTGLVLIESTDGVWTVTNYLGDSIDVVGDCEDCEDYNLISADEAAAEVSFSLGRSGKKWKAEDTAFDDLTGGDKYYSYSLATPGPLTVKIDENTHTFNRPPSGDVIESLVFRNIAENYVKVVKI